MASNDELEEQIQEMRLAVTALFGALKHITVEIGDFSHSLSEVSTRFMTRMGIVWESLGGKVPEENEPDSDEDPGAEIIPIKPNDDEEPAHA
jgi:hypothetical protein